MPAAVSRRASRNAGTSSTPSYPAPGTCRRTARSAATSAITWPRSVESLRLTSWIRAPRRAATAISPRPASMVRSTIRLGQAARTGQHETDRGRIERSTVGVLLQHGHHLDAVHRLRPGRVNIQHARQQPVRPAHRADRLPQAIIIGDGRGQPREHPRCGRQAVLRQPGPLPLVSDRPRAPATTVSGAPRPGSLTHVTGMQAPTLPDPRTGPAPRHKQRPAASRHFPGGCPRHQGSGTYSHRAAAGTCPDPQHSPAAP